MLRYDPNITQDEFKKMKTPWKCHMSWGWLRFRQISQKTDLLDSLRSNKKIEHNFSLFDIKEFAAKMQQLCGRMCLHIIWGDLAWTWGLGLNWALRLPAGEVLTVLDIRGLGYGYKVSEQKSVSNDECLSQADIHGDVWNRIISDYGLEIKWEDRTDDCDIGFIFMSNTLSIFPLFGV